MTDRTRRLLIRRFELLALGSILVDLAEDLVPLRYQLFDAIANLVFYLVRGSVFLGASLGKTSLRSL
jgi:hypothetical protein